MDITITEEYSGRTLLSYLKFTLKISSACITRLKKDEHGLEVNGEHVTVRRILKAGDILHVELDDSAEDTNTSITPINLPLDIIYEDNNVIVFNKPPYMPTHPSHNHHDDTLANGAAYLFMSRGIPFVFRPVGRLDRNTSGIVILGKNKASTAHFSNGREAGALTKNYIAIVAGEISDEQGEIDVPLKRQADSIIIRTVCSPEDEGAMEAKTHYKVLYRGHGISLVSIRLETGRTHQIRVHFSHLGHPLLGDDLYGEESQYIGRHALHAHRVFFTLPFSLESITLKADVPRDMRNAFSAITKEDISQFLKG